MKFRDLLETKDKFFKDLGVDYWAIAKIKTQGNVLTMTFNGAKGASNALDDIQDQNRAGYTAMIVDNNKVQVTKI